MKRRRGPAVQEHDHQELTGSRRGWVLAVRAAVLLALLVAGLVVGGVTSAVEIAVAQVTDTEPPAPPPDPGPDPAPNPDPAPDPGGSGGSGGGGSGSSSGGSAPPPSTPSEESTTPSDVVESPQSTEPEAAVSKQPKKKKKVAPPAKEEPAEPAAPGRSVREPTIGDASFADLIVGESSQPIAQIVAVGVPDEGGRSAMIYVLLLGAAALVGAWIISLTPVFGDSIGSFNVRFGLLAASGALLLGVVIASVG